MIHLESLPVRQRMLASALFLAFLSLDAAVSGGTFEADSNFEVREIRGRIRAAQFLSKATFGPTQDEIDALGTRIRQI